MSKNKNSNKNDNDKLRYVAYCRKSSEDNQERQAQSIESQQKELELIAKKEKLNVVDIYEEEKSAHTTGRKVFTEMIKTIETGKANAILVWHANRLTRNMTDGAIIIALMDSGMVREIKTPGRVFGSNSTDKFIILLEFGISKKDSDDKSEVVSRGLKTKCEKGSMPGRAPLGYLNTPYLPGGSRYIMEDPERFEIIQRIWNKMATGQYSVNELRSYLNNDLGFKTKKFKREGGGSLPISRLYKMFRDSFYCGEFEYPRGSGNIYQGKHKLMISRETFDSVQKILNKGTKTRSKTLVFDYTGTMHCGGCGAQITAEAKTKKQKNGNIHHYIYYRCTRRKDPNCKNQPIRAELLEDQIKEKIKKISIPPVFEKWASKWLKILYDQELETKELLLIKNNKRQSEIEREIDRLIEIYASPENREKDILNALELVEKKKKLKTELSTLEIGVSNIENKLQNGLLKSKEDFNFALYALQWLEKGTPGEKKGILAGLGYNLLLSNRKLDISLKKPFMILEDSHRGIVEECNRLEPLVFSTDKRKTDGSSSEFPLMLRERDLNPHQWLMRPLCCRYNIPHFYCTINLQFCNRYLTNSFKYGNIVLEVKLMNVEKLLEDVGFEVEEKLKEDTKSS